MALQLFDGFETSGTPNYVFRNGMTSGQNHTSVVGRDGVGRGISSGSSTAGVLVPLVTPAAAVIFGFGWYATANGTTAADSIYIYGDAGATQHLAIYLDGTNHLTVKRGTAASGTLLQASALSFALSSWHYVEVKATIADAGGICVVKVDGVEHLNTTGDTKNAGTLTTVSSVRLPTLNDNRIDDLYVCDGTGSAPYNDFLGERVVKAKRLVGNGAASQWTGSDGNSTDNYLLLDEDPLNTTDYVASSTAGQQDLYALSAATGLLSVDAVQVAAYTSKSDSGARSWKPLIRNTAGTVDTGAAVALSTTWTLQQGAVRQTDPAGAAWTTTTVNGIQAGAEVV